MKLMSARAPPSKIFAPVPRLVRDSSAENATAAGHGLRNCAFAVTLGK